MQRVSVPASSPRVVEFNVERDVHLITNERQILRDAELAALERAGSAETQRWPLIERIRA